MDFSGSATRLLNTGLLFYLDSLIYHGLLGSTDSLNSIGFLNGCDALIDTGFLADLNSLLHYGFLRQSESLACNGFLTFFDSLALVGLLVHCDSLILIGFTFHVRLALAVWGSCLVWLKSTPARNRTGNLRIRNPLLYPVELRERRLSLYVDGFLISTGSHLRHLVFFLCAIRFTVSVYFGPNDTLHDVGFLAWNDTLRLVGFLGTSNPTPQQPPVPSRSPAARYAYGRAFLQRTAG